MTTETLNELALFAGAGGGILGGHLLGWRTVCAVERDPYAAAVLAQRQNDGALHPFPVWNDVCTFDGKPWRGRVDVVSGGFPCQDISVAGGGAGLSGERSGLWREFARIIREVGPRYVFVENSPALAFRGLDVVLGDLAEMGYDAEWGVLGADDVGAPHVRKRIWIVAQLANAISERRSQGRAESEGREGGSAVGECGAHVPDADDHRSRLPIQSVGQSRGGESSDVGSNGETRHVADADRLRQQQPQGSEPDERRRPSDSREQSDAANTESRRRQARGLPVGTGAQEPVPVLGSPDVGNATVQDSANNGAPSQMNRNSLPLNAQVGGSLSPMWTEWLMGWPIGWTGLEPLETGRFRQWLHSHGTP
jgi:DNA (cytosine-5)-methyltransferase 1